MHIVLYSSNSNFYDYDNFSIKYFPACRKQFDRLFQANPHLKITVVSKIPAMFLVDFVNNEISEKAENVNYELNGIRENPEETAAFIASLKPDLAVAATFWVTPLDWLSLNDSIIGSYLEKNKIKAWYHPLDTVKKCFDKNQTFEFLKANNFNHAKAVYVHHNLYWSERNHKEIKTNYYKNTVLDEIKNLTYPLIIKDTTGLSSYGMEVVKTFGEAKTFLNSKRNNSDRMVEEFIKGIPFGLEIWGDENNYFITPPLMFSTNKYGITSPKQSIKAGPVNYNDYNVHELNKDMLKLARLLHFKGIAQVDLMFEPESKNWFIIEINPRLSGMTQTYGALYNSSIPEILYKISSSDFSIFKSDDFVLNIKFELLDKNIIDEISALNFVKYISQTEDKAAKQEREKGYCEIVISGKSKEDLTNNLNKLEKEFGQYSEEDFFEDGRKLISQL